MLGYFQMDSTRWIGREEFDTVDLQVWWKMHCIEAREGPVVVKVKSL